MRLDKWVSQNQKTISRTKAQELVTNGAVTVNGKIITQLSFEIKDKDEVIVDVSRCDPYVSRSAHKLIAVLDYFKFDVENLIALDVGISTGGFTQVLIDRGAQKVVGIDVGHGQLHENLKNNPKIILHEGLNAKEELNLLHDFDIIVIDVSFISVFKILDNIVKYLKNTGTLFILIKPQFEQINDQDRKLVLSDKKSLEIARRSSSDIIKKYKFFKKVDLYKVPLKGKDGNQEYFLRCQK